jgi:hypothetical protein
LFLGDLAPHTHTHMSHSHTHTCTCMCIYICIYIHAQIIYILHSHVHVTCSASHMHVPTLLLHLECFIPQSLRCRSLPSPHCSLKTQLIYIFFTSAAVLGLPLTPHGILKPPLATYRAARQLHKT